MSDKVTIAGKEFEVSPLRLKHLKEITGMIAQPTPSGVYDNLSRWFPFIVSSIQVKSPSFTPEQLEEATIDEINNIWEQIVAISGIKIITKVGEATPARDLTGDLSTDASVQPLNGTIVQ